jgi:biotin transport system substrate-specific component
VRVLFGPSGGYLLGFLLAAGGVGLLADAGRLAKPVAMPLLAMLAAHAIILATGAAFLSVSIGPTAAWFNGVEPFLAGALVKSLIAAVIVLVASSLRLRRSA